MLSFRLWDHICVATRQYQPSPLVLLVLLPLLVLLVLVLVVLVVLVALKPRDSAHSERVPSACSRDRREPCGSCL